MQNIAPFWRERGTDVRRWIVDSSMCEYGKAEGCYIYLYKKLPHPPLTSYLQPVFIAWENMIDAQT